MILKLALSFLFVAYFVATALLMPNSTEEQLCNGYHIIIQDSVTAHFIQTCDIVTELKEFGPSIKEMSLQAIDTEKMEKYLKKKNKLIDRIECYKTLSGHIRIEIRQRIPIMRIASNQGNFYIDQAGELIPVSPRYAVYVPLATGNISPAFAKETLYPLAVYLKSTPFWNAQIQQIYVLENEEIELIPTVGAHTILLGEGKAFEKKLCHLQLFYEEVLQKTGWNKYSKINLKYNNQIVCTPQK